MRLFLLFLLLFAGIDVYGQVYTVRGQVTDEKGAGLPCDVLLQSHDTSYKGITGREGAFLINEVRPGHYYITFSAGGYEKRRDSFALTTHPVDMGAIRLTAAIHELAEVQVVEKVLAMVQKDDTLEFNSAAFQVNPDADAADLVRKMPSMDLSNKQLKAQGETVLKILVDGKPFFGDDVYSSLKNLPADVIAKVQVYDEKGDQEQFTGFSEGNTTKTINIITRPDRRNAIFGKVYAGGGVSNGDEKYGLGGNLNRFAGDRRITLSTQWNNISEQNFTEQNPAATGDAGISKTKAAGLNYTDKWGKKLDISSSYFFSATEHTHDAQTRKTYVLAADSGQVYNETTPAASSSYSHRFTARLTYAIDSQNSIIGEPRLSLRKSNSSSATLGITDQAGILLNQTANNNNRNNTAYDASCNLLFRHKFRRKGRTLSVSANADNDNSLGAAYHTANNIFYTSPALSDSLNQQSAQTQLAQTLSGNATYTQPIGKGALLKLEYNINYQPSSAEKNTDDYSPATHTYSLPDSLYSNVFSAANTAQKAGASYLFHTGRCEFSAGLNYQFTQLNNEQSLPISYQLHHSYQNLLPDATMRWKFSKTRSLHVTYATSTQVPGASQLQRVVNNINPLHLYTGNPLLLQPFQHSLIARYSAMGKGGKNTLSASLNGRYTQQGIASRSLIAVTDTFVTPQHILLPKGSQLTMPENIDGGGSLVANVSYGLPLTALKCQLSLALNAGVNRLPAIINNAINYQNSKNGGINITLSSNISERVDFVITSASGLVGNTSSINSQLKTIYFSEIASASLNVISRTGFVFNINLNYHANPGLPAGYNSDYVLCNISAGKKILKKQRGDIRLSVFDLLNQNSNIQHTVTDTYIQDTRTSALQRYYMLVFTYKVRDFRKQK